MNGLTLPWLPPVMGPGNTAAPAVVFFDDFITGGFVEDAELSNESDPSGGKFSEVADRGQWLVTVIDGATDSGEIINISDAEPGGVLTLTTNDADGDGIDCQLNGEAFVVNADRDIYFACKMKITDVDLADWFVGLALTDTDVLGSTAGAVGFCSGDGSSAIVDGGSANVYAFLENTAFGTDSFTDTATDLVDATFIELSFHVKGASSVDYFINGNKVVSNSDSNVMLSAADALTPTMAVRAQSAAVATLEIDYILVAQERA
jgi:hypothetical protein